MARLFGSRSLPKYHENMLLVQMRPHRTTTSLAVSLAARGGSEGLSALAFLERAGMIRRVTPIRPRGVQFSGSLLSFATSGAARTLDIGSHAPIGEAVEIDRDEIRASAEGIGGAASALLTTADLQADDVGGGVSLVELENGQDVDALRRALADDAHVVSVSKVPIRYLQERASRSRASAPRIAATPPAASSMWNLARIRWAQALATPGFQDAGDIRVGVLDSGIERDHPDLNGRIADYVYEHPELPGASSLQDVIGHGTHVAGTIAASSANSFGINGICSPQLHSWKIFDDQPDLLEDPTTGQAEYVYFVEPVMYLAALLDCIDARMDVINLSIGGGGRPSASEADAFQRLIAGGTTIVASMGNEREFGSPISYPAAIPGIVAVGATGMTDGVAYFSNRGNHISLCAPGMAIWSTLPTNPGQTGWQAVRGSGGYWTRGAPFSRETDYDAWQGTSMAAPHVAAAAALYIANAGRQAPDAVRRALIGSCDRVAGMAGANFHPDYGYGRLNLEKLVKSAISSSSSAGQAPRRGSGPGRRT